jgi:hypothetical protein
MQRANIRTINGLPHNGSLPTRYRRVQNRAAAVLDAWIDIEAGCPSDDLSLTGHLHRLSCDTIRADLYGDPVKIKKQFGFKSTEKLEKTLRRCANELAGGTQEALVALANHVPFTLLRSFQTSKNEKELATTFLRDMQEQFDSRTRDTSNNRTDSTSTVRLMLPLMNFPVLRFSSDSNTDE